MRTRKHTTYAIPLDVAARVKAITECFGGMWSESAMATRLLESSVALCEDQSGSRVLPDIVVMYDIVMASNQGRIVPFPKGAGVPAQVDASNPTPASGPSKWASLWVKHDTKDALKVEAARTGTTVQQLADKLLASAVKQLPAK